MPLKVGVVGLGFMGSAHLEAYRGVPEFELAAVASSSEKKLSGDLGDVGGNLERGAGTFDFGPAARYRRAEELIADANVEAVDLCVPTHLHMPLALEALAAGKHVLVEKPMALSAEHCYRMLDAAKEANRVLMVAQVLRFFPEYAAARSAIRSGKLGTVRGASFRRRCAAPAWSQWLQDPAKSGGGVFDLLIHDIDFCQQLFGKPTAVGAIGYEDLPSGIDIVDARFFYLKGVPVVVKGGWHHPASFPFSMEFTIVCDGGTLEYSSQNPGVRLYSADGEASELDLPDHDGFTAELQAFVDACMRGSPSEQCPPEESATAVRMALAMNQSRERGGMPVMIG